jgi:transcriptional regulator with XRE-family HTH domain
VVVDRELPSFGAELRNRRLAAGLSLAELSRLTYYSKSHLSKVETGRKAPSIDLARRCDAQLHCDGELAALASPPVVTSTDSADPAVVNGVWIMSLSPDGRSEISGLPRREVLAAGVASAATWVLTPRPTPPMTSDVTSSFRLMLDEVRRLGQVMAPATLIPLLVSQTHTLRVMAGRADTPDRERLLVLAARFAEYTGWMAQEAGDEGAALWWTDQASQLAAAGGYSDLSAYALVRQGLVTMYRHDSMSTVHLANRAWHLTDDPRIRGLAAQREAQGHALAGDYDTCLRMLDRARVWLERPPRDDGPTIGTTTVNDPVGMTTAWCLYELGHPRKAVDQLEILLERLPPHAHRSRARYAARYALALAATGEVEHACTAIVPVLDVLDRTESATIRTDLQRLAQEFSRRRANATVRALSPRLTAALRTGPPNA